MGILKTPSTRTDYRMVGVTLRARVYSYISLYVLAKGITKASLLKELVMDWVDKQKAQESDMELVLQLKERVTMQWSEYIKKKPHSSMERYKQEIEKELLDKGIATSHIEIITKDFK